MLRFSNKGRLYCIKEVQAHMHILEVEEKAAPTVCSLAFIYFIAAHNTPPYARRNDALAWMLNLCPRTGKLDPQHPS